LAETQKYKLEKAKKEGLEEGEERGEKKNKLKIAKKMKDNGEKIEKIMLYTSLSREDSEGI